MKSKIEWTERTWNPMTGCTKISPGCANCYAETMAKRLKAMGQEKYRDGFKPTYHPQVVNEPHKWPKGKIIFVCSMSDLFHQAFTDEQIQSVFETMNATPRHTYQVLTKRPWRMFTLEAKGKIKFTPNIWAGVTVEDNNAVNRAEILKLVPAKIKFLSLEPLVGMPHDLIYPGIDWIILGGESGSLDKVRRMQLHWASIIQQQCKIHKIPFFYKQGGRLNPCKGHNRGLPQTKEENPSGFSKATFCKGAKGCKLLGDVEFHEYPEVK